MLLKIIFFSPFFQIKFWIIISCNSLVESKTNVLSNLVITVLYWSTKITRSSCLMTNRPNLIHNFFFVSFKVNSYVHRTFYLPGNVSICNICIVDVKFMYRERYLAKVKSTLPDYEILFYLFLSDCCLHAFLF